MQTISVAPRNKEDGANARTDTVIEAPEDAASNAFWMNPRSVIHPRTKPPMIPPMPKSPNAYIEWLMDHPIMRINVGSQLENM